MDGLECSEIKFSDIDLGDRIDSDFFVKRYLNITTQMKSVPTVKLGEMAVLTASAFYPAATQLYSIGDIAFVRCVDCVDYPIITTEQDGKFKKIPISFAEENSGVAMIRCGDIVITKVGTPCYASVVSDYDKVALSRTVLGVHCLNNKQIDPYYLMIFLRCKYGFYQLYRQRELTIQYQLTLPRVKAIDIFMSSKNFQNCIHSLCESYRTMQKESENLYQEAEKFFLFHVSIDAVSNDNAISIQDFSRSFLATGRLDAEYYQPKYDNLFRQLKRLSTVRLGDVVDIKKSIEPGSQFYAEEGIPFLRVSDISKRGIREPEIRISPKAIPGIEALYLKKDMILLSKDGSVGIAYKIEKDAK